MMTYNYHTGLKVRKNSPKAWFVLSLMAAVFSVYMVVNTLSPGVSTPLDPPQDATAAKLAHTRPILGGDRLYIPKINVDVAIVKGESEAVLEAGAWHRKPANGDPATGGNFVLSAHRFQLGYTPAQTRAKSPFYRIDQLGEGDQIFVDYDGERYGYTVVKTYKVERTAYEIEQRSGSAKMTLYSCDLGGEAVGREVVEAIPLGTVAWVDGTPKLKVIEN